MEVRVRGWSALWKGPLTDLCAFGIFHGERRSTIVRRLDRLCAGAVSKILSQGDFEGSLGKTFLFYPPPRSRLKARRALMVGLGKKEDFSPETLRAATAKAAVQARELKASRLSFILPDIEEMGREKADAASMAKVAAEGAGLALYSYVRYKSERDQKPGVSSLLLIASGDEAAARGLQPAADEAKIVCEAVGCARDVANTPSSDMTPELMARTAKEMAERCGVKCRVLDRKELEKIGMGGILGVSRGSSQPPKLILLEYNGSGKPERPVVLVGKAVTFDSGGISIKPSERMEEMKFDKSGGAAVFGALKAAAELKLSLSVVGVVPCVENMPGGSAYKPGDVLRFYNGKTAEIINTDAEGRLILADALAYAEKNYRPKAIVDIATLTGACVVALGTHASGLFSNNPELSGQIKRAAEKSGERVWELPLWKDYYEHLKSEVADMKNVGGRPGGAITAAAFLSNFVENTPWAHLDIAGTAWTQEGTLEKPYHPKGATGVGVRLLVEFLKEAH